MRVRRVDIGRRMRRIAVLDDSVTVSGGGFARSNHSIGIQAQMGDVRKGDRSCNGGDEA